MYFQRKDGIAVAAVLTVALVKDQWELFQPRHLDGTTGKFIWVRRV